MNYANYNSNRKPFTPKVAVKNFTDLQIYQQALEGSVFVCSEIINFLKATKSANLKKVSEKVKDKNESVNLGQKFEDIVEEAIIKNMCQIALTIPHLIAEAHSKRFGAGTEPLKILDEVMLKCNRMVAYLEQTRDILNIGMETARFEEEIKKYFSIRHKTLNLQRVWRKYITENAKQ
jgi:hypothetical protein